MKLIVTGTGRCGTGAMSQVLTKAGLPCSHEGTFTFRGVSNPDCTLEADSSWMAVPYLSHYPTTPIVLVHRHPLAVASSLVGIGFFTTPSQYRTFLYRKMPELKTLTPFEAACRFYVRWNELALEYAEVVADIENPPWDRIAALTPDLTEEAIAAAVPQVSPTYNHRTRGNVDPTATPPDVWEMRTKLLEAGES